ncbi:MAG: VCBS repeat-containing protein, partial [Actinobacteria bacterium]|nr:VCBS repeat-containing protein [Actinomycetota bacterium]
PSIMPDYSGGIAVGDFDHTSPHPDIAVLYGDDDPEDRKLVVFSSNAPFDYDSTVYDIPLPYEDYRPGALGAGDFDEDGDDDLIWGHYDESEPGLGPQDPPLLVARVDADGGDVGPPQEITNITGTPVVAIDIFDANGDGRVDALVYVGGEVDGSLPADPDHLGAGVVTLLDAFSLEADAFVETAYRFVFWDRAGNGRGLAHGDFDGDGVTDLATVNDFGEVLVMTGNGDGTYVPSGRSWQVVTGETESAGPVQSLDAADFDGDGLAEILVGDMSNAPFNIVYWLNASR